MCRGSVKIFLTLTCSMNLQFFVLLEQIIVEIMMNCVLNAVNDHSFTNNAVIFICINVFFWPLSKY